MKIAVDFDNTITEQDYGDITSPQPFRKNIVKFLNSLADKGHFLFLYTNRQGDYLKEAINRCKEADLKLDYEYAYKFNGKPDYDLLLDDKAVDINTFIGLWRNYGIQSREL